MASNVINRYVWLLNTLLQHKELSLKEISNLWKNSGLGDNKPLPRRTFQMHRDAIEDLFNIVGYHIESRGISDHFGSDTVYFFGLLPF